MAALKLEPGEKNILIIEDDINFSEILKSFAEGYGFKANQAYDGETGIQMAKAQIPDAIILDVMLPIADGWEVLRTLKNTEETKHIPIHMMSAASFDKKNSWRTALSALCLNRLPNRALLRPLRTLN